MRQSLPVRAVRAGMESIIHHVCGHVRCIRKDLKFALKTTLLNGVVNVAESE